MPRQDDLADRKRRSLLTAFGTGLAGLVSGVGRSQPVLSDPRSSASAIIDDAAPEKPQVTIGHRSTRSVMERSLSRAGAVGNGETIDTGAIQEAVAEVERNTRFEIYGSNTPYLGAGELVWPQGLFLVDDAIRVTRSLRLRGEGQAEFSSGARIQQQWPGRDLFRVEPIAEGCSLGLTNLVLRANGGGGSGGALLRVTKAAGQCNSLRIAEVVFATPQTYAIDVQRSDDLLINRCLFDVSATGCIRLGGTSDDDKVSNARISEGYFYSVGGICIELINTEGLIVQGNHIYTATATKGFLVSSGTKGVRSVIVKGNILRAVECLADVASVDGLVIDSNIGDAMGAGERSTRSLVRCSGPCADILLTGNRLRGNLGAAGFYDDSAAEVSGAVISGNSFTATGGHGPALLAGNTVGRIGDNHAAGFAQNGVGYRWATAGGAMSPRTISPNNAAIVMLPVVGSMAGDSVVLGPVGTTLPDGIAVSAHAANDRIDIRYANVTNRAIRIPAHDLSVLVTR